MFISFCTIANYLGKLTVCKYKILFYYCCTCYLQRAYVTMESHHEEKITELLGKIRADESSDLNDGGAEPGPSFPRGQSDMSLKGSYQGPEMYTSNCGRTDPGPSSQTDWYDSAQDSYQGSELNVGYDG